MTQSIYKYPLKVTDYQNIELPGTGPHEAQILTVQVQHGIPCLWALVYPELPKLKRTFGIYGTGHVITDFIKSYLGTFQQAGGNLVFHVFEIQNTIKPI